MSYKILFRRDTAENWEQFNPILDNGELGVETDTNQFKLGDGVSHWNSLGYKSGVGPVGPAGTVESADSLTLNQVESTSNPASGSIKVYTKADGKLYTLDSEGTETELGAGNKEPIPMLYSELVSAIAVSELTPNQQYLITDYRTVRVIANDANQGRPPEWDSQTSYYAGYVVTYNGVTYTSKSNTNDDQPDYYTDKWEVKEGYHIGDLEPLIVTAISSSKLAIQAISTIYPDEIIYYTIDAPYEVQDQNEWWGWNFEHYGTIIYRKNLSKNIEAYFDWRNTKARAWKNSETGDINNPTYNGDYFESAASEYQDYDSIVRTETKNWLLSDWGEGEIPPEVFATWTNSDPTNITYEHHESIPEGYYAVKFNGGGTYRLMLPYNIQEVEGNPWVSVSRYIDITDPNEYVRIILIDSIDDSNPVEVVRYTYEDVQQDWYADWRPFYSLDKSSNKKYIAFESNTTNPNYLDQIEAGYFNGYELSQQNISIGTMDWFNTRVPNIIIKEDCHIIKIGLETRKCFMQNGSNNITIGECVDNIYFLNQNDNHHIIIGNGCSNISFNGNSSNIKIDEWNSNIYFNNANHCWIQPMSNYNGTINSSWTSIGFDY